MYLSITSCVLSRRAGVAPQDELFEALRLCRRAGFEYVDLQLERQAQPGYPLALDGWEGWVDRVGEEAQRLGVSFPQAHAFGYRTRESTSDAIDRPWYEARIRRSILAAQRLGVQWLVLHTADFDADESYDFEKTRRFNIAYWAPFVELATRSGVGIAFENMYLSGHHQRYCSLAEELLDLLRAFDGARVGACWDTGHAAVAGQDQPAAIRLLGSRLRALHLHDNHGRPKGDEHLIPYFGSVDWDPILTALAQTGYEGAFSLEVKQPAQILPPQLTGDLLTFLHALGGEMARRVEVLKGETVHA